MTTTEFLLNRLAMLGRRTFIQSSAAALAGLVASRPLAAQDRPQRAPNILLIVADDLGYGDLSCHGAEDVKTPHIDALAQSGVRCTDGYVSAPVCSPSRAGLLTGRYQNRFGHEFNPGAGRFPDVQFGLPLSEKTVADHLKSAGYATGLIGKWHLGSTGPFHPLNRGFGEFFGFLSGVHPYSDLKDPQRSRLLRNSESVTEKEYLTDAFSREACGFIERHRKEPFFLYLAYNAIHTPLERPPGRYLRQFDEVQPRRRRFMAGMLAAMDSGIGQVMEKLASLELEEETLIFFLSDNGGPTEGNGSRNGPFSGLKGDLAEGGIRVPFIVRWKNRLKPSVYRQPIISLDILPTALAAAGAKLADNSRLDGVNLLPFLDGASNNPPHEHLHWRHLPEYAVRQGRWKLVKAEAMNAPALYDLAADPAEKNDLSLRYPEMVKKLLEQHLQWDAQLAKPIWPAPPKKEREPAKGDGEDAAD